MTLDVKAYIQACSVCARCKPSRSAPSGTLLPLPIPQASWTHISMDFITDLPRSSGCTVIWVVVDRFSKMAHFVPLPGLPSARELADLFLNHVFRLHGAADDIASDRGVQFISRFWRSFCLRLGIKLSFSSWFHPETNGQTERTNQTLEQYLRCFVSDCQEEWPHINPSRRWLITTLSMLPLRCLRSGVWGAGILDSLLWPGLPLTHRWWINGSRIDDLFGRWHGGISVVRWRSRRSLLIVIAL